MKKVILTVAAVIFITLVVPCIVAAVMGGIQA